MITAVADASQIAEARRLVSQFARGAGVAEARIAQVALVVTELATNLLKHAGAGQILASQYDDAEGTGLEVLALDRGRGMTDIARCMNDGYSTAGGQGTGLGAIERLADDLRIYSRPGLGSAILDGSGKALRQTCGARYSARQSRHIQGNRSRETNGRSPSQSRAAPSCSPTEPATASRRHGPPRLQCAFSAITRGRRVRNWWTPFTAP